MKTHISIFCIAALLVTGCSYPRFLSRPSKIHANPFGAYITLTLEDGRLVTGELIAIDSFALWVQGEKISELIAAANKRGLTEPDTSRFSGTYGWLPVPINKIKAFSLRCARPGSYPFAAVALLNFSTLSHGWWLFISAPLNTLAILPLTIIESNSYILHWKGVGWEQSLKAGTTKVPQKRHLVSLEQAKMFARFPQGIPAGVLPMH